MALVVRVVRTTMIQERELVGFPSAVFAPVASVAFFPFCVLHGKPAVLGKSWLFPLCAEPGLWAETTKRNSRHARRKASEMPGAKLSRQA